MQHRIKCLLTAVFLAGLAAAGMGQSNLYVATNGLDTRNGAGDWTNAVATISNGIAHASTAGDTVWVSNGAYVLSAQLSITRAITVSAWSASSADTIIDGNGAVRCVNISAAATLSGFTITNGYTMNAYGAGINMSAGTVTGCVIIGNTVNYTNKWGGTGSGGGGVYMTAGTTRDCEIRDNRAYDSSGGGVCNLGGTLLNCTVIGNTATNGGGVYMRSGTVQGCTVRANLANNVTDGTGGGGGGLLATSSGTVRDCIIEKNTNTCTYNACQGGGVMVGNGVVVSNCTISENQSGYGGGVAINGATAQVVDSMISNNVAVDQSRGGGVTINSYGTVERCTIIGNKCSGRGAGILCNKGGIVRNCLIVGNTNAGTAGGGMLLEFIQQNGGYVDSCTIVSNYAASGRGAGIDMNDWDYGITTPTNGVTNCVVYFNWGGGNIYPATAVLLSNIWYSSSTVALPANQGNITSDPLFIDANAGNYRLMTRSPCVNAGTNQSWMTGASAVDRDRRVRIRYGRVDMGAYEVIYSGFVFSAY